MGCLRSRSIPADIVYLNGQFVPKADAKVSVDERGFMFGDGVYEVTRVINGRFFEWPRHAARLTRSLAELKFHFPTSMDELLKLQTTLLEKNGLMQGEAYVYVQVTRGVAPRAHQFPPSSVPCGLYMYAAGLGSMADMHAKGVGVITVPEIRWARCDIKSLNLIPATQAKQQAVEAGCYEALFVRDDGFITEAAHSNVFFVMDNCLYTHPSNNRILPGITRAVVLEIARDLQIKVKEEAVPLKSLPKFDECFITSTNADVLPVVTIDGKKIGSGAPGAMTKRLYEVLAARLVHGKPQ
jgi:D-alanine transaminase